MKDQEIRSTWQLALRLLNSQRPLSRKVADILVDELEEAGVTEEDIDRVMASKPEEKSISLKKGDQVLLVNQTDRSMPDGLYVIGGYEKWFGVFHDSLGDLAISPVLYPTKEECVGRQSSKPRFLGAMSTAWLASLHEPPFEQNGEGHANKEDESHLGTSTS